jgi:hypothetical protein
MALSEMLSSKLIWAFVLLPRPSGLLSANNKTSRSLTSKNKYVVISRTYPPKKINGMLDIC